ncbi:MAG: DNA-binding protein WhiA [Lachnospiraceae bacterium]|nr:DNA-binding protein WhiA [Lachnospiraceae bacterium]
MSFSMEVKSELFGVTPQARHCRIAELSALVAECGKIEVDKSGHLHIKLQTESGYVARKCSILLKRLSEVPVSVMIRTAKGKPSHAQYFMEIRGEQNVRKVLELLKLKLSGGDGLLKADGMVFLHTCCKRAFLRGTFLASGSVSNPQKSYHFEISEPEHMRAEQLLELIRSFDVDAKPIVRKNYHVVYVKEGAQVAELLNIMEAHIALMKFENVRIVKDVRNSVNRQVNCETANLSKTVNAARKQYEDIILIRDSVGLHVLSEALETVARLRLEYPEASLIELGEMLSPKLGKSGVNHRLKKISEYAESLRS